MSESACIFTKLNNFSNQNLKMICSLVVNIYGFGDINVIMNVVYEFS
jgi:hypothetical protein